MPRLSKEELETIRNRHEENLLAYHSILVAQADRVHLLQHIDHLTRLLEASDNETVRLRRSLAE